MRCGYYDDLQNYKFIIAVLVQMSGMIYESKHLSSKILLLGLLNSVLKKVIGFQDWFNFIF